MKRKRRKNETMMIKRLKKSESVENKDDRVEKTGLRRISGLFVKKKD